jgi:hypothetical protein
MTGFVVRQFRGIAPRLADRLLGDDQAQDCANVRFKSGTLVPLKANSAVATLPKSGTIQTIHRFGQDVASDTNYWFHWAADVDVVRGPIAGDTAERTYWTGDGVPKVADSSNALTGGTEYPMASYTLGVPAPGSAPLVVVGGTPDSDTALAEDRVYVVTFVTAWGEEGCPSAASAQVTLQVGQTVTLTLPDIPSGSYNFDAKRIYRSVAGTGTTTYLYVGEVSAATGEYVDSVLAADLGEELPSLYYEMPPASLQGLIAGPNGSMAAFTGHDVYFPEPFKPHAWPSSYVLSVTDEVMGLGVIDTTWVVLTKGKPRLIQGTHPASYAMVDSDLAQACVSKRSIAHIDGGVVFASPDGLFLISGSGSRNLTAPFFTRAEWQALDPDTLHGYVIDNQYVGFHSSSAGFVLDLETGSMSPLDWYASAGYYDPIRDALFLVTGNNALVKFDSGAALTQSWRSKPFYSPRPLNMGRGRVEAASYPVTFKAIATLETSANATTVAAASSSLLTASGNQVTYTATVADSDAFPLPSGFLAKEWEFEVSGAMEIYSAGFAETVQELAGG